MQTDSLDVVKDIPAARCGAINLKINRPDYPAAFSFVEQVNWQIKTEPADRANFSRPPIREMPQLVTDEEVIMLDERMKVPRVGLLVCSVIQLVACICFFVASVFNFYSWIYVTSPDVYHRDLTFSLSGMFLALSFGSAATSILLFLVARNIKQHLNYPFVVAGLVVGLVLPFSPVTFTQVPFVIWAFVIMCLRKTRDVFHAQTMEIRTRDGLQKPVVKQISKDASNVNWKFALVTTFVGLLAMIAIPICAFFFFPYIRFIELLMLGIVSLIFLGLGIFWFSRTPIRE